jgi:lysophospholipase L1-like esterase
MNRHLCVLILLVVAGCESGSLTGAAPEPARGDVSAREDSLRRSPPTLSGEQLIAELDGREARVLCEQAGRSIDLCAATAARQGAPRSCTATLESCRAQDPGPTTDCRDARFDFPEPCTATVQEYLQCVKARSDQQNCSFDVVFVPSPEECLPLLQKCPYLQSEFGSISAIVPRCAADSPVRVDDNDDIVGLDCGRPRPTRMVTLGDSIAWCFLPDFTTCAPTVIAEYLREHYAPELQYQSVAVPGAITADVLGQARLVPPGPGHLLVWIYVGGNDLARCAQPTLPPTQACIENLMAALPGRWSEVFAYFTDSERFPDGVTFMLNTQYSLFDQCRHALGPERLAFAEATLQRFNRDIIMQSALDRADAVAIDQYPDFLGHAGNANRRGCPHCSRDDNSYWLFDGTHPNKRGGQHIADKWKVAIDRAYGGSCP